MLIHICTVNTNDGREIVIERCDGNRSSGLAYAYPVRNTQGQIVGAVTLVADITARGNPNANCAEPAIPLDATLAMIEVAVSVFAGMPWAASAFNYNSSIKIKWHCLPVSESVAS